jgi:acid phosphatase
LTDTGRQTTYALGRRLRHLYVDQLGFMPPIISNANNMYLRSSPIPRALESLHQTFWGMYPRSARTSSFEPPTIVARAFTEETLYPNESNCHRFRQLARMFAQRAAERCICPQNPPITVFPDKGYPSLSNDMTWD